MKKRLFGISLLLSMLIISLCGNAQPMRMDNTLLWQISGKGMKKPSYLFGTIHLICPDDYLWTNTMQRAFSNSEKICLEMDLDDPKLMTEAAMAFVDNTGKVLSDYFTTEDYADLKRYLKDSIGIDITNLENMKPIALQTVFTVKSPVCETPVSYEEKMVENAKNAKKEVIGLETVEEQMTAMESIPVDSIVKEIVDMIHGKSDDQDIYAQMIALYKAQDIQGLQKLIMATEDYGTAINTLLDSRNKKWISRMSAMMAKSSVFFAVGAGHLYGEQGVISLLRKQGYQVDPLNYTN